MKKSTALRLAAGTAGALVWAHLTREECAKANADNEYEPGLALEMVRAVAADEEALEDIAERYDAHVLIERIPSDSPKWCAWMRLGELDHDLEPIGSGHTPQEAVEAMVASARELAAGYADLTVVA